MTVYVPHPETLGSIACPGAATAVECGQFDAEAGELGYAPLVIHSHGFGGAKNPDFSVEPAHFVDNQAAINLSYNPEYHERTRHIHRRHFFIREAVEDMQITVPFVASADNIADFFNSPY